MASRSGLSKVQFEFTNPAFGTWEPVWRQLRDVREGTGGFLTGDYLVAHPREWLDHSVKQTDSDGVERWVPNSSPTIPSPKLRARRKLASYENFAATLIETMKSALTREQPVRRVGDGASEAETPLEQWWQNVDGAGTHIDDFMSTCEDIALTFGHMFAYMDRPENTDAETAADQPMPFLRVYTPLDAWDWMVDDLGQLVAIKFAEIAPRKDFVAAWRPELQCRVLDLQGWRLYNQKGALVGQGEHQMGVLPVVPLFSNRRPLAPYIGASVLGDPKLFIDLYNLKSEVRELLRNQTFSILNIPLGTGDQAMSVQDAQAMMGSTGGTNNVLFSGTAAAFIQPEPTNIESYHNEMARVLRSIFRLASLTWEADSKDAEAEGSLKLKREDMNIRLAKYADEMEKADYGLAKLFYRAHYGADAGATKFENEDVQVKYPDNFDMTPFDEVLEQADAAMTLGMPALFLKELRKRLARKFDGMADLPQSLLDDIDEAIDSAPDDLTPQEKAKQNVEMMQQSLKATGKPTIPKVPAA
jgi:hypothetical protein